MESREGHAVFCRKCHHGFFYELGKRATDDGGLSHMGRGAAPLQTSPQVFEHFLAPGNPGGGCLYCIFKMRANKRFIQEEENTRGQGREGSL